MKKQYFSFLQIAALAFVIVLAACSNPSDTPPNNPPPPPLSIKGKFTTNSKDRYFTAQETSGGVTTSFARAVGRAVSPTEVAIAGILDDGDITFRLRGFYDKESGAFTLQAASSQIKYSITGTAGGDTTASIATRNNASEPFGVPTFVKVDTEISGADLAAGMTSTGEEELVDGLTKNDVWGVWYDEDTSDGEYKYVVNEWGLTVMAKKDGEWVEGQLMGFSTITEDPEDGSIEVIGDATVARYEPVNLDPEEFAAYLESEGYEVFDRSNFYLPIADELGIFADTSFYHEFGEGAYQGTYQGALVTGNNRYMVMIGYGDGNGYGSAEKPFVLFRIMQEGEDNDLLYYDNDYVHPPNTPFAAATLEGALEKALEVIIATGDTSATYQEFPWPFTTGGMNMSLALEAWREEHPEPTLPSPEPQPGSAEFEEWVETQKAYWESYHDLFTEQLLENFPERFLDPDKLLVEGSEKYNDLRDQYVNEDGNPKVTTEYYKWKVTEAGGRLIIEAYSTSTTDSEFNNALVDSYADAVALDKLVTTPFATLSR